MRLRAFWETQLPVPCSVCRLPVYRTQAWDLDHITPRSLGGRDVDVWPAHARCNRSKGARILTLEPYTDSIPRKHDG